MSQAIATLAPGQIARVRQRTYLIEEIVTPRRAADSTLVRLSCVDDDNQGQPLEVLWENELDPQVLTGEAWESVESKGFDDSRYLDIFFMPRAKGVRRGMYRNVGVYIGVIGWFPRCIVRSIEGLFYQHHLLARYKALACKSNLIDAAG